MRRCPVICRIDGKAFHTFTKGFQKPFDNILVQSMQETMKYLCENIQGCVLGYTQSDEITLVLVDYKKLNSAAWFDYETQKMCSIAASMATMIFNRTFAKNVEAYITALDNKISSDNGNQMDTEGNTSIECDKYKNVLLKAVEKGAMFDARVFNIPKEEVTNCVYWRQLDASRNSVEMVGHAYFTSKQLHKKSCNDIQDMLMLEKGVNWNDFPTYLKRGSCCIREEKIELNQASSKARGHWVIDSDIPLFKEEGREYIEKRIYVEE